MDVDEGMDFEEGSSKTDFDVVKTYIETVIIKENKVVSMKVLQSVYGDNSNDKHCRHKLKQRINKEFLDLFYNLFNRVKSAQKLFSAKAYLIIPKYPNSTHSLK